MSTVYEVPTQPQATTQTVTLNGIIYKLTFQWCAPANCWVVSVADQSGNRIADSLPMVTGADLLAQLEYLDIGSGGALVVQSDNNPDLVPNYQTLGSTGHLFFVSP